MGRLIDERDGTKMEFRGEIDTVVNPSEKAFFSVRDIHAWYGESYIVQGVSFDVNKGEVLSLLGRNGAGKTSTLRTLARASNPALKSGEIWLDGQPVHKMKAFQAAQAGIQLVPEDRRIIGGLTVEENLVLAQVSGQKGWTIEKIYDHFPRLAERRSQEAVTMSGGEQQMLAVARALARDLKILFLDEPYEASPRSSCTRLSASFSKSATSASPRSSSSRTPWRHCVSPTAP